VWNQTKKQAFRRNTKSKGEDLAKLLTLEDLQQHFENARDRLAHDRQSILSLAPLPDNFNRDEYGFSYMRAERIGMEAITERLEKISWLPMQLDPQSEIILENRNAMKKWLASAQNAQPDGEAFGNDFIHALTRTALLDGWDSKKFKNLATQVGSLFHDLSCLIGLIYYGVWMSENGIAGVPISDPDNLERTAQEIAALTQSPEVMRLLKQRKTVEKKESHKALEKKRGPVLHLIHDAAWGAESPPLLH
jgi:hypothetical protein